MIDYPSDLCKHWQFEARKDRHCRSIARRTAYRRSPIALIVGALIAVALTGSGFAGLGPMANHLMASPQSESYEDGYTPVGAVPEWTITTQAVDTSSSHLVVSSDRRRNEWLANDELWRNAIAAVARKLDENIARGAGKLVLVDRELIKRKLLVPGRVHTQVYRTAQPVSIEPMVDEIDDTGNYLEWYCCFVELDFDDEFFEWARDEYERRLVEDRVRQTALVSLSGFSLLVVLFGFLKFNHRTQGLYTGRLQSIAIFAAIAVILVALALSYSVAWL